MRYGDWRTSNLEQGHWFLSTIYIVRSACFAFALGVIATPSLADTCTPETTICMERGDIEVGGVRLTDVCLRVESSEHCVRDAPENSCAPFAIQSVGASDPLLDGQCIMTSEECTRSVNGLCDSWDREYNCWNGPADSADAELVERHYRNFEETIASDCAALESNSACSYIDTVTTEGAGSRTINHYPINRLWWAREKRFECAGSGPVDTCSQIIADPVCTEDSEPVCASVGADGECDVWNRSFHCYADPSLNAGCEEINICEGENCDGAPEEPSDDFANATTWLNFLDQAASQNTCEADGTLEEGDTVEDLSSCADGELPYIEPQVFGGDHDWCSYTNLYDCCDGDDNLGRCGDHELEVAQAREMGATHYLRGSCSRTILFGTICVERRSYYCVYDSKFARVFQEQAHVQTGSQFGSQCPGLTIEQLESLDVTTMDLSEVFGDMLDDVAVPVEDLIIQRLSEDMGLFESDVQETMQ